MDFIGGEEYLVYLSMLASLETSSSQVRVQGDHEPGSDYPLFQRMLLLPPDPQYLIPDNDVGVTIPDTEQLIISKSKIQALDYEPFYLSLATTRLGLASLGLAATVLFYVL